MAIVLAGDIGGTHTRLMLVDYAQHNQEVIARETFYNNEYPSLIDIINLFIENSPSPRKDITSACIAVAGPIINGVAKLTNIPWEISLSGLKKNIGIPNVALINDFEAMGYGVFTLSENDYYCLQKGKKDTHSAKALIGAGTGLGVAIILKQNKKITIIPTEGGHVDFAPTDDMQMELLVYLRKKLHRISLERLLSGPGFINIYKFVRDNPLYHEKESAALRKALHQTNFSGATITDFALIHNDSMAKRAVDIFIKIYGSSVGNLALSTLPYGGLYIGGGIAPCLIEKIKSPLFMDNYSDKGRMSRLLQDIPLYVIENTEVGLQGAALYANELINC